MAPGGKTVRAAADLKAMRAAGAVGKTREEGLTIMAAEARRIQEAAKYEAEIRAAMLRRSSKDSQDDAEAGEASWMSDPDDPAEFWQTLQDAGPKPTEEPTASQMPLLTEVEATAALLKFRPLKGTVAELERLLSFRADPNAPLQTGDITPLRKVICFASEKHVEAMRELLIQHGAHESKDDAKRWVTRQKADFYEHVRVKAFYEDPRDFNPWSASAEAGL